MIRRRDRKLPEEVFQRVLGQLGYRVSFQESLPDRPIDPGGVLLVDAREMQRELLARLAALANRNICRHILALTQKEERTYRKINLLEAGVEMIVPLDLVHLERHLSIALSELFEESDDT